MAVTDPVSPAPPSGAPSLQPNVALDAGKKIGRFFLDNAIFSSLVVVVLIITFIDPSFISLHTLRNVLLNSSVRVIVALGAAFAILTAGADLSAGAFVGLASVVAGSLVQTAEYGHQFYPNIHDSWLWVHAPATRLLVPILLAIAICTAGGFLNGLFIARLSVPPFIATLGMMLIVQGATYRYFDSEPNNSQPIAGLRPEFTLLGSGAVGPDPYSVPYLCMIAAVVVLLMWILMNKTVFGKNVYAIGGNAQAARVSGIRIGRTTMVMYALAGALYGLGGVLQAARTGGASNTYGVGYELDAIAACVVGGVSVTGGIGRVSGIVSGVLIFSVMDFGLSYVDVTPHWQKIVRGVIIVSAVAWDVRKYLAKK